MNKIFKTIVIFIVIITSIGCSDKKSQVVIASKPMTEQYIIAEMLTYLIEENSDLEVVKKLGIGGGTSNIHPGMISGEIDIYPEYTGTGWMFVLKKELINDPNELYKSVKESYSNEFDIWWSKLYGFNDTYGIAVKEEIAKEYNLKTYSDLARESENLSLGAEYDFYEREDGYPGLEKVYGFDFKDKKEIDIGLKYQAISEGQVDVINVFSTDGRLKEYNLVVLEDDLNFFPSYYAATIVREETLNKHKSLKNILGKLDNKISNQEMTYMNYLVEIEKMDPKKVAMDFLKEKGLLIGNN